ncbi:MAG TPA: transcriptional regulator [Candidatus Binatia bacterium]|nr:transcriptional regulator [Candidatus Binatia bacterium]
MARGNQLTRQWQLLQLLDRAAGVSVEDAARELDCTVRTIWRDLRVLEAAGFPIYDEAQADGRRSIWRIQESFKQRLPLRLSLSELAALLMSRDLATAVGPASPAISAAFEKIAGVLSRDALALIDRMREVVGVRAMGAKLQAPAAEHLRVIQEGLVGRRRLRMTYQSMSRDELTDRRVDPYHLTLFEGGFYLVGHCHLRGDVRIFAVERIRDLDILAVRFTPPASFDVSRYLEGAWGILRGDIVTVRVVFSRDVGRYVKDRLWHPTQRVREREDGRVEMTLRVADTLEVRRWILGYGPGAEVLEPAALREALRQDAEALARKLLPVRRPPVEMEGHRDATPGSVPSSPTTPRSARLPGRGATSTQRRI